MRKFQIFKLPEITKVLERIKENPKDIVSMSVEYILNYLAIEESNQLRSDHLEDPVQDRQLFELKEWRNRRIRLPYEKEINIHYPALLHPDFRFPQQTFRLVEVLNDKFDKDICMAYLNGESDRDISYISDEDGEKIAHSTVSNRVNQRLTPKVEAFMTRDFYGKCYLALDFDGEYFKIEQPKNEKKKSYQKTSLIRVLGLNAETLHWEVLAFVPMPSESTLGYDLVIDHLINHGIGTVYLAVTDFNPSFNEAIATSLIGTSRQGCRFHLTKSILDKLHKSERDDEDEQLIREFLVMLFHFAYDQTTTREQALDMMHALSTAFEYLCPDALSTLQTYYRETLAYKDYPADLSRELDTTSYVERANEQDRRREKVMNNCNPNDESLEIISYGETIREDQEWFNKSEGTPKDARLSKAVHKELQDQAYYEAIKVIQSYPQYISSDLSDKQYIALWCNIISVPVIVNEREISIGFLAVYGVDKKKNSQLLSFEPIRQHDLTEAEKVAQSLIERNLDMNTVQLIIQNRPYLYVFEAFKEYFPYSEPFIESSYLSTCIRYLTSGESEEQELVGSKFDRILSIQNYDIAYWGLKYFRRYLERTELDRIQWFLQDFRIKDLISVYHLIGRKRPWQDYKITDFSYPNNCKAKVNKLCNKPCSVRKTVELLIASFKRKRNQKHST